MSERGAQNEMPGRGAFITLEGIEGAGKTTAIAEVERVLREHGVRTLCTREPGGTAIAEAVRELVLSPRDDGEALHPRAETLLVFAAREQHLREVIRPALEAGTWVICDRFTDATIAYQGAGREQDLAPIQWLAEWIHGDLWPDLTLLLDLPEEVGLARAHGRGTPDRMERENRAFFSRVRGAYRQLAARHPKRFAPIDASAELPAVRAAVQDAIERFCQERAA